MSQITRAVRFATKLCRHRSTIASLEALSDHTLNDIGVPRADILAISNCQSCVPLKRPDSPRQPTNPPPVRSEEE